MSKTSPGMAKRLGAGLLAASLGIFGIALAAPAGATATVTTERLAGQTRYSTAAAVAAAAYPGGSDRVILATGQNFPDALAASGLAGKLNAPVLLTLTASLSDEAKAAITSLKATKVTIVGGTSAVSTNVENQLKAMGLTVDRVAGNDRYETAGAIATAIGTKIRAIVASGEVSADALASGPIASDQEHTASPILLVKVGSVPPATKAALAGVPKVIIAGGTARISDATAAEIKSDSADPAPQRVAGADRQATARLLAEWAGTNFAWDPTSIILAAPRSLQSDFSPDALVAGPLGGLRNAPVLLARDTNSQGTDVDTFAKANSDTIAKVTGVGGTAVLGDSALNGAAASAKTAPSGTQTFTVPQTVEKRKVSTLPSGPFDARTCVVSGITAGSVVDARLVPTADVTKAADGTVTLVDALPGPGDNVYDETAFAAVAPGVPEAAIVNVNGTGVAGAAGAGAQEVNDIVASVGAISVSFVGYAPKDVTLLVWQDQSGLTANATDLTVPSSPNVLAKTPRESFGVGCQTIFFNEAATGAVTPGGTIGNVSKDQDIFSVSANSYFYDANDTLQLDSTPGVGTTCNQVTFAQFETALSNGDILNAVGSYNQNRDLPSTLCIEDAAPLAPSAPVTPGSAFMTPQGTSIKIMFNESGTITTDAYNVYRVVRPASGTCPDFNTVAGRPSFTKITTIADPSPTADNNADVTYTDPNLQLNTFYCYAVTSVDDGSESPGLTNGAAGTNSGGTADTGNPTILDVRATDAGTLGIVDIGDVHRFIFSEAMAPTVDDAGELYRVADADALPSVAEIKCATNATCALNATATTINGTTYAINQVLTVTITAAPTVVQAGTVAGVSYPATVTNVSSGWTDIALNQLSLATGDKTVDVANFNTGP